jgi:SMC interacting uncharacterized protein involved in chromosome segregation
VLEDPVPSDALMQGQEDSSIKDSINRNRWGILQTYKYHIEDLNLDVGNVTEQKDRIKGQYSILWREKEELKKECEKLKNECEELKKKLTEQEDLLQAVLEHVSPPVCIVFSYNADDSGIGRRSPNRIDDVPHFDFVVG